MYKDLVLKNILKRLLHQTREDENNVIFKNLLEYNRQFDLLNSMLIFLTLLIRFIFSSVTLKKEQINIE